MTDLSSVFSMIYQNFMVGYIGDPLLAGGIMLVGLLALMFKYNIPTTGLLVVLFPSVLIAVQFGYIQGVYAWILLVIAGVVTALAVARITRQ